MKNRIRIPLLIVAAATTLLFSCAPPPVSIEQRISDFVSSLNGNRSDTYTNLDPSIAAYGLTKTTTTLWDSNFNPAQKPFTYTPNPPNTLTPSNVQIVIYDGSLVNLGTFQFIMVNIGTASDNWVIHGLQTPPGTPLF